MQQTQAQVSSTVVAKLQLQSHRRRQLQPHLHILETQTQQLSTLNIQET